MRDPVPGLLLLGALLLGGCEADDGGAAAEDAAPTPPAQTDASAPPPRAACEAAPEGSAEVAAPILGATLADRWHEGWLASPAVADLEGDGVPEIIAARAGLLIAWHRDGEVVFRAEVEGRIWSSPVVADLVGGPELEVAAAARGRIYAWGATGEVLPGFPVEWSDELRALAAGDLDGDGDLELIAVSTRVHEGDILHAFHGDGRPVEGWPPNAAGSGCDEACYVTGGFDQTLAVGDLDGDGAAEVWAPQDNAYMSLHHGDGRMLPAAAEFERPSVFAGVRFLHDPVAARQGYADDEEAADQAHFTNSAPALADLDGDGRPELIVLGSVQNAAQTDRKRGVSLWALRPDGSRLPGWETPYHAPDYLAGLWDFEGTNVVAATNQVSVADLDPERAGPELLFAGFDGYIHCVDAAGQLLWRHQYTQSDRVLTAGLAVADLSGDGRPEVVFATYSPEPDSSHLFVLDASGARLHQLPLPERGSMAVPTIADTDGDGSVEVLVALKDGVDRERQLLVFDVPGASANCLPWPTGRGNLQRSGWVR